MIYNVRLYRKEEARTVEIPGFRFCADAQAELDRQLATGQYSSGYVDQEPDSYQPGPQEPANWFGK